MSYRIQDKPKPMARRTMQDTATPMLITVHNGATAHLAIPCWYQEVQKPVRAIHHNHHWHHYVGWPSPNHPDHICQIAYEGTHYGHKCPDGHDHCRRTCSHYVDMRNIFPIHLLEEGYNDTPRITFATKPEGLETLAWIDAKEDWVVRVSFMPKLVDAIEKPKNYHFSVFVDAPGSEIDAYNRRTGDPVKKIIPDRTDVVAHGVLRILPSSYE